MAIQLGEILGSFIKQIMNSNIQKKPQRYRNGKCRDSLESPNFKRDKTSSERLDEKNLSTQQNNRLVTDNLLKQPKQLKTHLSFGAQSGQNLRDEAMARTAGQLDPEMIESAHHRFQNRSSNQLEFSAQRENNFEKLSGSRRQIMSKMIDKQSGTQIVMLEGEKTESASHQETEKRLEELKMVDHGQDSNVSSLDSCQSREEQPADQINSQDNQERNNTKKQLEIEVDHDNKTFSLTARKLSPDIRMKSGTFSPQSQPPPGSIGQGNGNGRKNSYQLQKFTPTELSVSPGRRQTTIKQITLENVELETRNNNVSSQQQNKTKSRSGFQGAGSKNHTGTNLKRPSNPSASPTTSKQAAREENYAQQSPLKITKMQVPKKLDPAASQVSKSRKAQLKHSQQSVSEDSSSHNAHKTPSPQPDKSHLNVKLPQFMQSTMNDGMRNCLHQQNQKEPAQAFLGGESARRSLKSSQEMGQGQKSSRGPQMRDTGLRNSDQVETKFGSVAAPSVSGVPQQTHITRSSNASNPETEAEKLAKLSASQNKKSIPLSKTHSTHSKVMENEDNEQEDDDTPYGGINDTEFKNFLLLENQNQKTPQTVLELDRTQRGSRKSRDDSRLVDLGLPSSGVHNVTFLHQNHHHLAHFPYEQYYLGQDFFMPQSKQSTTARHSSLESDGQNEKNYDLYIDTRKGKVGLQSSKIPTCPPQGSKPQRAKRKNKSVQNVNKLLSHSDKQQFLQILDKYAKSDDSNEMQVILMKLWRLSHRYKEQLENQGESQQTKNSSSHGARQVLQHEPMKLISVRVLHQITASFAMALLLLLNFRDQLSSHIKGFADFDEQDIMLFDELKQSFQIHFVKLPLQKIQKQVQNELKATSKEQKQSVLNKPVCSFDEFKIIILSVFGQNLVKIYEQEGRDMQSNDRQKEDDGLYPQPQFRRALKQESFDLLNSIMRYAFLILTSKLSTLKRDEFRQDDPHQKRERIDVNKLRMMVDIAQREGKASPRIRVQISHILDIFNYAESKEPNKDTKHEFKAKDAISPMEESLRKFCQPLLGKIYNREGLSYGVAKDPLKIKTKKSRTDMSQKFQSLQEPKRATKEGFQNYQFSTESGLMSTKAHSKKMIWEERTADPKGEDKYDEEINGIIKVNDLLGRPDTSSDTRFKHSFVNLNSRLQRNVVSQRQKYRNNIQTRRNIALQQSNQNEQSRGFMLNHAKDEYIGKLSENAGVGNAQFQAHQELRQDGLTTARGSNEALSNQIAADIDSRPKSMNIARRPKAYAQTRDQSQLNDMTNKFESAQATRPSTTKNYGRPRQGISIKANLRQHSQPEIQEIAQAKNAFQTVINSPSAGTYAPKFKGSTVDIQSKVESLRAADKAVYEKIKTKLNPAGIEQNQSFSRSRILQQVPILQQKVAGVLSGDLYSAKLRGESQVVRVGEDFLTLDEYTALYSGETNDHLTKVAADMAFVGRSDEQQDKIISINSDQFDFASEQMSESPSALQKYVRSLQMWSEKGKEELKSIKVVTHGHKSTKFKMHNNQTGTIGDGTLDPKGLRYGDLLQLYPQRASATHRPHQDHQPAQKPEKSSKGKKQTARLETRSPDSLVNGSPGVGLKGNLMIQNEQARRLEEYKRHQKQQAGMFKLKKDSQKSDQSKNPPLTIGNKIKITQLQMNKIKPNTMSFNFQEQAQKTTGRFVEVQPERPGKTPPLPSVDMAESLGVSTNRLKPSDTSDISLHAKVSRPRMLNTRPKNTQNINEIDIVPSKNELSGSPGTVLIPQHGLQYKKQSTLLLKKTSSAGKNDTESQV